MWRNENPAGGNVKWVSCWENSFEVPQKAKYRTTIWSINSTPRHILQSTEASIQTTASTYIFAAVLLAIAKKWKQPKRTPMNR